MNNKEYIEFTEKKLDRLNGSSCKPYTITKHLNGLYDLNYGLDTIVWMLEPRELWLLVNTLYTLDILGGLKNDNMEERKKENILIIMLQMSGNNRIFTLKR